MNHKEIIMSDSRNTQDRYFVIDQGATVLHHTGEQWFRWDTHDGVVRTNIAWSFDDPRLREISRDEALSFLK